jgi:hypothetical protein
MGRKIVDDKIKPLTIWVRESEIRFVGKVKKFDQAKEIVVKRLKTAFEKMLLEAKN